MHREPRFLKEGDGPDQEVAGSGHLGCFWSSLWEIEALCPSRLTRPPQIDHQSTISCYQLIDPLCKVSCFWAGSVRMLRGAGLDGLSDRSGYRVNVNNEGFSQEVFRECLVIYMYMYMYMYHHMYVYTYHLYPPVCTTTTGCTLRSRHAPAWHGMAWHGMVQHLLSSSTSTYLGPTLG